MLNSYARVLRKGSFETSYWADLEDGDGFVVKRFRVPCDFGREKVEKLGQMLHKNQLPIRAYGCGEFGKLLVCDYMAMGSLFDHLHDHLPFEPSRSAASRPIALTSDDDSPTLWANHLQRELSSTFPAAYIAVAALDAIRFRFLGKGTLGTSFRTDLEDRDVISMKRFKILCGYGREKVEKLVKMVHENLLPIRAYGCVEFGKLLVCDYMAMGSLSDHLHGKFWFP
ncbi:hypothetical protein Acr_04g0004450 [Actinidia rufa]|uniref:Protein kinase superfamily protein n=1 Tax=Actinidia rufa TaxID=165716 RepID=A0A7J0EJ89_9ERIC|nr:hypothetical protein Acr_04g0004450 [Actinidia rufa]